MNSLGWVPQPICLESSKKVGSWTLTCTQGEHCRNTNTDQSNAALAKECQKWPANYQKQERGLDRFSLTASEGTNSVDTLIWDFQPLDCERVTFCCLTPSSLPFVVFLSGSPRKGNQVETLCWAMMCFSPPPPYSSFFDFLFKA